MDNTRIKRHSNAVCGEGHVAKRFCYSENGLRTSDPASEGESSSSDNKKDMAKASALESKATRAIANDNGKQSAQAPVGRRSGDSPAVVPIKKRRIQIAEVMRSPSPPAKSPAPPSPQSVFREKLPEVGCIPLCAISNPASPRSLSPTLKSPSRRSSASFPPQSLQQSVSPLQSLAHQPGGLGSDLEEGELPDHSPSLLAPFSTDNGNAGPCMQDTVSDTKTSPQLSEGEVPSSMSKDDRLHWDLNTEMATWDEDIGKVPADDDEHPHRSSSVNSEGRSHECLEMGQANDADGDKKVEEKSEGYASHENHYEDDKTHTDELETGEILQEEQESAEVVMETVVEIREKVMEEDLEDGQELVEEEEMQVLDNAPAIVEEDMAGKNEKQGLDDFENLGPATSRNVESKETDYHSYDQATSGRFQENVSLAQGAVDKGVPMDGYLTLEGGDGHEEYSVHSHDDDDMPERDLARYDRPSRSLSDDGEGWNRTSEEPELEERVDYGDSDFRDADETGMDADDRMQEESTWKGEDRTYDKGTTKLTPMQGEAEQAHQTLTKDGEPTETRPEKSMRNRMTGWDKLPEGFDNAEEAMRAAKEMSSQRGGRGGVWSGPRGRGSTSSAQSGSRFGPGPSRGNARDGFSSGRAEGYYGDRHHDEVMHDRDRFRHGRRVDDNYNPQSAARGRDPGRRPGMFGRGRVGDWSDPLPTHGNEWGSGQHRPSSRFSGPLATRDRDFLDEPGSRISPGRVGMRSTVSAGRGSRGGYAHVGRDPPGDMDRGVRYQLRGDQASGMNVGGRGFGTVSGPGLGGMHDRGGRGMMDRYRSGAMDSRRSLSPLRRPHPLDRPSMMSRVTSMRSESRVVRSRTPPSSQHRHPEPSGRSPHSPPSRLSLAMREEDGYGYHDMNFRRPPSRSNFPSQRSSPHLHSPSFTSERDGRVLASGKHSPLLKSSINFAHMRSQDDRMVAHQRSNQSESDDGRRPMGSFPTDGDFRRSSPLRGGDKEGEKGEFYRRERDREDDRRQEPYRSSSRDGRYSTGHRHRNAQEADDEVAPRRRRPA